MPDPRPAPSKRELPDALASPTEMHLIAVVVPDVLRAAAAHYRQAGQDEVHRRTLLALRRFLGQSVAYAGEPAEVPDPFGEIDGL